MRILRLRDYYAPELTASSHLEDDMSAACKKHNITSINYTPMPTRGISNDVRREYKNRKYEEMRDGYVIVHRFSMFREGKNPLQRAFRYICCNIKEYFLSTREKDIDIVHSGSTPPTQGALSAMVAKRLSKKYKRKVPFVYNLQDVFPDSLVNAGMTYEGSLLWKIGRKIENYTYKNADKIIVISKGFKRNIMAKGVPEDKITVISNWIDIDVVQPVEKENNTLYEEFGISRDKYIVVYAGNFGAAQGADIVLKAAEKLKDKADIQFVIFGGGAYFEDAKVQAALLPNVIINGLLPQKRVSEVYSLGDVALITCKPGTGNAGMPSKTWSIMACNTPIIASFDTDSNLADVLRSSEAGKCVQPGNTEALVDAILNFRNLTNKICHGRDYVAKYASKNACISRYVNVLEEVVEGENR